MRAPDDGGERMWPLGRRAEDFVLWGCSDSRMLESLSILHLRDGYRTDGRFVRLRLKLALGLRPCLCGRMLSDSNIPSQSHTGTAGSFIQLFL